MKLLLILSLLFLSSSPCLADISLESDIKPIVVEAKPEVEERPDFMPVAETKEISSANVDRSPATVQENKQEPKEENPITQDKQEDTRVSLQLSNSLLLGNAYFGGKPTHAEFNSYDLDLLVLKKNWLYGTQLDYIFNPGSIRVFNLGINAGFKHDWNRLQLMIYGGLGITNYKEKSNLQDISAYGPSISATAAVNFFVTHNLYLNVNYKYVHAMYTNDLSYWGSNPRGDVVFDLKGLGFGLGWSF